MPTKDEQIDAIMKDLIEEPQDNFKRIIRGALLRAYNRGYEAGCMKAQEQMMEAVAMSNTGSGNTGDWNTGSGNTGDCNTGDSNTGDWNTGNWNTGNWNTGDWNTGDWNTGNSNTGNSNTGDWNTGNRNTGDWNTNDFESGCFCTQGDGLRFFNRPSSMFRKDWESSRARYTLGKMSDLIVEWISSSEMSEDEKIQNPSHETTGGCLKVTDKRDARQEWWDGLTDDDKKEVMSLPNFDADIFRECTGIDVMKAQEQMMEDALRGGRTGMTTKMQSCIDHIKTSTDVDPWAMEMVEQIFTEYDKRFDKALEIIDGCKFKYKEEECDPWDGIMWYNKALEQAKQEIEALKGGEQE